MSLIAGQWGDSAPVGSTISVPDLNSFLQSVLDSDAIQLASGMVQTRNNLGEAIELVPLAYVNKFFGGPAALIPSEPNYYGNLKFEVIITLDAQHGPVSTPQNAAQFAQQWVKASADTTGVAMEQLVTATFPGVDYGVYFTNKQAYQAQLAASRKASAAGGANTPTI